ncbi:MAG: 50S ribosomal protein L18Ae [Candidatus Nanosalina sp.]
MTEYRFSGRLDQGTLVTSFERTVEAESLEHAREKVYSELGREHSVTRGKIEIQEEEEQ